jgi:hypothetical protein
VWMMVISVSIFNACNNTVKTGDKIVITENKVLQQKDGSISLKIEKAECYSDKENPSGNTAEWNVFVSKSGRFDVWLSSATKDTTDLKYENSVMLSILDNRLEARPACDNVILNSSDVSYPYFRADSFIGSVFIQDTGSYNIQLISEKILPKNSVVGPADTDVTKLLSVSLTPALR